MATIMPRSLSRPMLLLRVIAAFRTLSFEIVYVVNLYFSGTSRSAILFSFKTASFSAHNEDSSVEIGLIVCAGKGSRPTTWISAIKGALFAC